MISRVKIRSLNNLVHKISWKRHQTTRNFAIFRRVSRIRFRPICRSPQRKNKVFSIRLSPQSVSFSTVDYDEIKSLCDHPEKILIDVRSPNEVKMGRIPQSINIPLDDIGEVLATDICPEEFERIYGFKKPDVNAYIILYCRCGNRAEAAAETVAALGYKNVHVYSGSWLDYVRNKCED